LNQINVLNAKEKEGPGFGNGIDDKTWVTEELDCLMFRTPIGVLAQRTATHLYKPKRGQIR